MQVVIKPSAISGRVAAPPSKSYSHRLIICAALADGKSTVRGVSFSEDILATLDCIKALGADYSISGDTVTVTGAPKSLSRGAVFGCRESGSTLRFFMPVSLALGNFAKFTGTARLIERGIGIYEDLFKERNISVQKSPCEISVSGHLDAGRYCVLGNVSSQFISGLMFALPLLDGDSEICLLPPVESRGYLNITAGALKTFGVEVSGTDGNLIKVRGNQKYLPADVRVEGDWSNAAFLLALNELGGDVTVEGLCGTSLQGDRVCLELFKRLDTASPVIDISGCPDLAPILFAVSAAKHGALFTGTRRLKIKESDRAAAMAAELAKFGISVDVDENSVTVHGGVLKTPDKVLCGHNDHRIVMALSVLGTAVGGTIDGCEAVRKSYPDFFSVLESINTKVEYNDGI